MAGELVRKFGSVEIHARPEDNYVDATALCKLANREWYSYTKRKETKRFLHALESRISTGTPNGGLKLVEVTSGRGGHTWIHPQIVIHFIQWASPEFAVQVTEWVQELLSTGKVELRPNTVTLTVEQFEKMTGRMEHMQQQIDRITMSPMLQPPVLGVPRFTVRERLKWKGWHTTSKEIRRKIHKRALAKIDSWCPDQGPDTAGGPGGGGPDRFYGPMLGLLDEAIDETHEEVLHAARLAPPHLFSPETERKAS